MFYDAFIDEMSKIAKSLRRLGLRDTKARENLAKTLKMLPKGGPEGRHAGIKEMRKGWAHYPKHMKPLMEATLRNAVL